MGSIGDYGLYGGLWALWGGMGSIGDYGLYRWLWAHTEPMVLEGAMGSIGFYRHALIPVP